MEQDFAAILTDCAPLTAIVPATKIFPSNYKQGLAGTQIRYRKITGAPGLHMQGSDGLTSSLMQIDIRGPVADNVSAYGIVLNVRNVLVGKHGAGGLLHPFRGVVGDTDFRLISLRQDRGVAFEKPETTEYYTASLDFDVWSRAA